MAQPMHRVLAIQEILFNVFGFLGPGSNANNAQVCRQWSDIALDTAWKAVDPAVFRSLAPMRASTIGLGADISVLTFTRSVTVDDWRRFLRSSARVRGYFDEAYEGRYRLSISAVAEIAATRTTLNIFPKLEYILAGTLYFEPFIMSPSVTSIELMFCYKQAGATEGRHTISSVLNNIKDRMPGLDSIRIQSEEECVRTYDVEIGQFLQHFPRLRTLSLPLYCLNASIAKAISRLPHLEGIWCDLQAHIVPYTRNCTFRELAVPDHELDAEAFPALRMFSTSIHSIPDFRSFLTQQNFPSNLLSYLWIHSMNLPSSDEVGNLIACLAETCTSLEDLSLVFHRLEYDGPSNLRNATRLKFQHLLPIIEFQRLVDFSIVHPYPLDVTDEEIFEFAPKCTTLRTLSLNPHPIVAGATSLTLAAVVPFSYHCQHLVELGLYLDATTLPTAFYLPGPYPLAAHIRIGRSPIPITSTIISTAYPDIARYLATSLSGLCTFRWSSEDHMSPIVTENHRTYGPRGWMSTLGQDVRTIEEVAKFENAWRVVEEMMKLVLQERTFLGRYMNDVIRSRDERRRQYSELQQKHEALLEDRRLPDVVDKEVQAD